MNNDAYKQLSEELKKVNSALINIGREHAQGNVTDAYYQIVTNQYAPRRQVLKSILLGYHYSQKGGLK